MVKVFVPFIILAMYTSNILSSGRQFWQLGGKSSRLQLGGPGFKMYCSWKLSPTKYYIFYLQTMVGSCRWSATTYFIQICYR